MNHLEEYAQLAHMEAESLMVVAEEESDPRATQVAYILVWLAKLADALALEVRKI